MYLNFYNLEREPFHITPNPEFLFSSPSHREALAVITYGVERRRGFIAIIGEVGLGKTTIIRSYLDQADKKALKTIYIFNPDVSFGGLLKAIYQELGLVPETDDVPEMVNRLHRLLIDEYKQGHTVVLIIDEAQNLPTETLENLRMLSNLETPADKLLQIVFVGQPELEEKLNLNELRQLNQRIVMRTHINPFSRRESVAYIQHRLSKAGRNDISIFTKSALNRIINYSKGIPRVINIICGNALVTGFGYHQEQITARTIKEVIADFEGKKKRHLLRWLLVSLSLVLIISGIFMLYPYADQVLSRDRKIFTSQSPEPRITKAETVVAPEPVQASSIITEVKPPSEKETSTSKANISRPAKTTFPVKRIVKKGDTLYSMVQEVYGSSNKETVEWVKRHNPRIRKINRILIGDELQFPELGNR